MLVSIFFFIIAANNLIKVVRDSLFLSRFPITQLPYVYLLVALLASLIIAVFISSPLLHPAQHVT